MGIRWRLILTNPFISNTIFHAWEYEAVPMDSIKESYDVGIVLGGFSQFDVYPYKDRMNVSSAANRFLDALYLYKKGIIKKLLISGGDGRLLGEKMSESESTKAYLLGIGVPESDILIENKSRNTHENAVFTKEYLNNQGLSNAKCLLITSAFHMRRSIGCFKKVGLNCEPFPAHFIAERIELKASSWILPDNLAFFKWEMFLKEWVGCVVYKLQGFI